MAYRDTFTVCVFFFVFSLNIAALSVIEFAVSESKESQSKELVLNLDHSNFSDTVSKHNLVVVEFYAPWCGPCKKLAPEYEKAASILSSEDPPVILAKVDASNERNKELATEFEIKGFPTIKILRNGGKNVQDYKGPRDADGIVAYLKKQSGPASTEIKSVEDASRLIDGNKIVVVGVFPEFSGEKFENFTALAEKLRSDYEFGHTLDDKLLPRGESTMSGPTVRLFKPFDKNSADFQDFNVDALENFVEEASVPTVTLFTKDPSSHPYMIKFFNNPNAKAMLFLNFSGDLVDAFESKYHDVAEQHKGQGISFLMGDLEASQNAFQYFGIEKDKAPLIIIQTNDGKKYVKPYLEPDHIASWVKEYKEGNVRPYKRSEPIPKVNNEPVKVVVADSLEDTVFNSGKNVFLELYAPWSDYCRKFTPTLDEVAVSFQSDADIIIAKIDFTANEIPKDIFKANGHPTLYFRSASGNLLPYKGNRTKEDIIDFIQKNRDKTAQKDSRKDDSLKDDM